MEKTISVRINRKMVEKLKKLKIHPRQSYSEVIEILLKHAKIKKAVM